MDNKLLSDLRQFKGYFHSWTGKLNDFQHQVNTLKDLEANGALRTYQSSDDAEIAASRKVDAEIQEAKNAVANLESQARRNQSAISSAQREMENSFRANAAVRAQSSKLKIWQWILIYFISFYITSGVCAALAFVGIASFPGFGITSESAAAISFGGSIVIYVLIVVVMVAIVKGIKSSAASKEKRQNKKAQKNFKDTENRLALVTTQLQGEINSIEGQLNSLISDTSTCREIALQKAAAINASHIEQQINQLRKCGSEIDDLHAKLTGMNLLYSENDWPCIDEIEQRVATGRALTLQEALLQVDERKRHDDVISSLNAQLSEQKKLRAVTENGFSAILQQGQERMRQAERLHNEATRQRNVQHMHQMAAAAIQIGQSANTNHLIREQNQLLKEIYA